MSEIIEMAKKAKKASREVAKLNTEEKNEILLEMAKKIDENRGFILKANKIDVENAKNRGLKDSMIDRLVLNDKRIDLMVDSLRKLVDLKDYVGDVVTERNLKNGLRLVEKKVGFGVIGVIYESRPNVTSDVCGICLKSSSTVILKGGSESINSNEALIRLLKESCPIDNVFQLITSSDRAIVKKMLESEEYIDLIIPRGGEGLINFVRENSQIPIIKTGKGNCHIYIDENFDLEKSKRIIINAKVQRPSVCNALDKILIHKNVSESSIKEIIEELRKNSVEVRGGKEMQKIIECKPATEKDWSEEYLDLILSIKMVDSIDEAIKHINKYGTKHSDAILSKNKESIKQFFNEVDSAVVYSNTSTRFTDGYEFGLGTEIGISTQKLHARGPMALKALTTTKYLISGSGQIRK